MQITWHIRKATAEDATGLTRCMASAYATYQKRMGGVRLPPMDVNYLSEINCYPTWVVGSEQGILGGLIMVFENKHASIANIGVDSRFQGQGIGGGLMKFAESIARENNFSVLHLATHILLYENIALYRHLGWKESGRDKSTVFMQKEI